MFPSTTSLSLSLSHTHTHTHIHTIHQCTPRTRRDTNPKSIAVQVTNDLFKEPQVR